MDDAWASLEPHWQAAFELMWEAYVAGTIPVGAVITDGTGAVVARGRNRITEEHEGSVAGTRLAHAEINALTQLPASSRYVDHTIHSTLEPCLLCFGALSISRLGAIDYAASDPYAGACRIEIDIPLVQNGPIAVTGPIAGWPELLSQSLVIANWHTRASPWRLYRAIELFPPEAHDSAARLLALQPSLDLEAGLPALLPRILSDVLA